LLGNAKKDVIEEKPLDLLKENRHLRKKVSFFFSSYFYFEEKKVKLTKKKKKKEQNNSDRYWEYLCKSRV
jgi:hypothetical protein